MTNPMHHNESEQKERPIYSPANVQVVEEVVKVTFLPRKSKDGTETVSLWNDGKSVAIFQRNQFLVPLKDGFSKTISVITNPEKDKVVAITPYDGVRVGKFLKFSRPNGENTPPIFVESAMKSFTDKNTGKVTNETQLEFRAYFTLQDGIYKGQVCSQGLRYYFTEKNGKLAWKFVLADGSKTQAKQSTWGQKLLDLFKSCGDSLVQDITVINIPEDGNILPELEKLLLKADKKVELTFEGGWLNAIDPLRESDEDEVGFVVPPVTKEELTKMAHSVGIPADNADDM